MDANIYSKFIREELKLEPDELPDYVETDLVQYRTRGKCTLPDGSTREITFVSFHPEHTDGPCVKLMLESGEVVWTREIKLVAA
jgi:hypothetical protein